jgi:hypothetical protein
MTTNLYHFKVVFANKTRGMRNIPANTYAEALNKLYYPSTDFSHIQPVNEAHLFGLCASGVYVGDNKLATPGLYDVKEF